MTIVIISFFVLNIYFFQCYITNMIWPNRQHIKRMELSFRFITVQEVYRATCLLMLCLLVHVFFDIKETTLFKVIELYNINYKYGKDSNL